MAEREAKPPWSAVPRAVKAEVARILGSPVASAERVYGGYAPSATFRLVLRNGRRAFLKSTYPLPKGSAVIWGVAAEERAYRALGARIRPWAPALFGSFDVDGWHGLVLEDLGPADVPPWTPRLVRRAAHDYAAFAQSITAEGGPAPERFVEAYRERLDLDDHLLRLAISAIAGLFAQRAPEPPIPGLPRLRSIQRRQLRSSLAWAARLDDLPEPRSLAAVPD